MKKFTLLLVAMAFIVTAMAQTGPTFTAGKFTAKALKNNTAFKGGETVGTKPVNQVVSSKATLEDPSIIVTKYDMQSNASNQNRLYYYGDGTIGATTQFSHTDNFGDRGTGYNYFDGTQWGTPPTARVETTKSGWPSYAPFGANGEIFVSHHMTAGLIVSTRENKGTGAWTQTILPGPAGATDISWPRVVTNGPDHNTIHILCATYVTYQGMENCLLYYRSQDGGQTWDISAHVFPEISSLDYLSVPADDYVWAEPKGDTLCFMVGDSWMDLFIMKSTDNGDNWTKTTVWPCPYNKWDGGDTTGTFWCPDGASAIALDNSGKAHILTGLMRASGDEAGDKYWVPKTDGMLYWNEDMPAWPEVLDPDQLSADGNLIGWVLDTNVFYVDNAKIAYYFVSMTGHPSITIDEDNYIYAVWDGVTMLEDVDGFLLRHLFGRGYDVVNQEWGDITDLTSDLLYTWSECVFPTFSPTSSETRLHLIFQEDEVAGIYQYGSQGFQGQQSTTDNDIIYMNPVKYFYNGVNDIPGSASFSVLQNYPNPAGDHTSVAVNLNRAGDLSLKVTNTTGQILYLQDKGRVSPGQYGFSIDCRNWAPGVYFYTVQSGNDVITKKMMVN